MTVKDVLIKPKEVVVAGYEDPFHPPKNSPKLEVTSEQERYLKEILDTCCADSMSAKKAYNAIMYLLEQIEIPEIPPAPVLSTIAPATSVIPAAAFTLVATGTGFAADSFISWNGSPLATTFTSDTELSAPLDLSAATMAADYAVAVVNFGGVLSNSLVFSLTSAVLLSSKQEKEYKQKEDEDPKHVTHPIEHKGQDKK